MFNLATKIEQKHKTFDWFRFFFVNLQKICRRSNEKFMGNYKLIAIDVDGTLVRSDQSISPRTLDALLRVQEQGVKVCICSGRPTYGIAPHAETLRLAEYGGYVVSFNGGGIVDWSTKEEVYAKTLDRSVLSYLCECTRKHGFSILTYVDEHIVAEGKDVAANRYVQFTSMRNKMPIHPVPDFLTEVTYPISKCMIVGDPEPLHLLEQEMVPQLEGKAEAYRSEPFFLEVVPQGIEKAQGLAALLAHLGYDRSELMAFGDGFNDLTMIQYAGLGVAMGNAQASIKKAADFVTLSNEADGISVAIEKFILRPLDTPY